MSRPCWAGSSSTARDRRPLDASVRVISAGLRRRGATGGRVQGRTTAEVSSTVDYQLAGVAYRITNATICIYQQPSAPREASEPPEDLPGSSGRRAGHLMALVFRSPRAVDPRVLLW